MDDLQKKIDFKLPSIWKIVAFHLFNIKKTWVQLITNQTQNLKN